MTFILGFVASNALHKMCTKYMQTCFEFRQQNTIIFIILLNILTISIDVILQCFFIYTDVIFWKYWCQLFFNASRLKLCLFMLLNNMYKTWIQINICRIRDCESMADNKATLQYISNRLTTDINSPIFWMCWLLETNSRCLIFHRCE